MELDEAFAFLMQPRVLIGIAVALVALWLLKKLFSRPPTQKHVLPARCQSCGWTGQVSKFKPVCPRCAKPIAV